jgi:hypothetical protein
MALIISKPSISFHFIIISLPKLQRETYFTLYVDQGWPNSLVMWMLLGFSLLGYLIMFQKLIKFQLNNEVECGKYYLKTYLEKL